jgi:putative transposase
LCIRKTSDACRFAYNWALETKRTAYENDGTLLAWYDLNKLLTELKQDHHFLKEVYSQSLQQAIKRLHLAFKQFFRRYKQGKNKLGYPKFRRRKYHKQSFDVPQFFRVDFSAQHVHLPKIGKVKTIFHRRFKGTPKMCTVVMTNTGKFFISIVVEDGEKPPAKQHATQKTSVGIDVRLTTYATLSTGEKIRNPRYLQNSLKRLQCLHQRLNKKTKGSQNWEKARQRLARCYERISHQPEDFHHKLSTRLIRENQANMVESLNVRGMVCNRRLAQPIADAAWSNFQRMLKYKAEWFGVTLIEVRRFAPTSKRCHICGFMNETLTLSDREWTCRECRTPHDRDANAAKNIKMMGLAFIMTPREPREEPVELSAMAETVKQETPSFKAG